MPLAAAIARSSGDVMKPRTRSALAPTYGVVTVTVALSIRGYCRTLSVRTACSPATRISRFTTIARTGRRMKRSVKRTRASAVLRVRVDLGFELGGAGHDDGGAVSELERAGGHQLLPFAHAVEQRHVVAALRPRA